MTKREWIQAIIQGHTDLPVAQHWMGYFNSAVARTLTPPECHYRYMGWFDAPDHFDMSAMGSRELDRLIRFNNYTGRCFGCLGKGNNINFGHGGPGEFFVKTNRRDAHGLVAEFETGVLAELQFRPHFYHTHAHPVTTPEDLHRLQLPDLTDSDRFASLQLDAQFLQSKGEYVCGSLNGFFSGLHYFLMEYQNVMISFIENHRLLHDMLEVLGEWNITAAERLVEAGVDSVVFCDDLGSKSGMLMSPAHYRTFIKPWHRKLCHRVHELGATVHLHSHGAIVPILDDVAECGFDFVNPFDPEEGWEVEQVLKTYGDRFVVVGGFPTKFWDYSSVEQEDYLARMVELSRKYGRFIFMDSGGVPESVRKENYERLTDASRHLRGVEDVPGCV